ncbi:MAG: PHP domain-containing protein [Gammaproteobacteria bacterium]
MPASTLIDLHTHTTASDGSMPPGALLTAAHDAGVELLALTDHDTTAAYAGLPAPPPGLTVIGGIELSAVWRRQGIHILGLAIAIDSDAMVGACATQAHARTTRARAIADELGRRGISDAFDGAARQAGGGVIGRPHFAQHLLEIGAVKSLEQAYRKYLGKGQAVNGTLHWPSLGTAIGWIRDAGGVAVLAHPAHYRLTRMRLNELLSDFVAAGGQALELISGAQTPAITALLGELARRHELAVSVGSDFHHPQQHWNRLGRSLPSGSDLKPVWELW